MPWSAFLGPGRNQLNSTELPGYGEPVQNPGLAQAQKAIV